MNDELALKVLGKIFPAWTEEETKEQFKWLSLMSRLKYDGYRGYLAGARFLESLADWVQQFPPDKRDAAYRFIRERLVYIGPYELQHLVERVYPETVQRILVREAARGLRIPIYRIWSDAGTASAYKTLLRRSLFFGLSDGARIDAFRRANEGRIINDQVVVATEIDQRKWDSMLKELREELKDADAKFAFIFLLDDFVASGTTLLRKENGAWKGKLQRFWEASADKLDSHCTPDVRIVVHHYIATHFADGVVRARDDDARAEKAGAWFRAVEFSSGLVLPAEMRLTAAAIPAMAELIEGYYDPSIETKSIRLGGDTAKWGFSNGGLALVLEHNTPNNSIALLWADTAGANGAHAMRPLFRRRQRFFG